MSKDIKELIETLAIAFCIGGTIIGIAGFSYKSCTENTAQEEKSFQVCIEKGNDPCLCKGHFASECDQNHTHRNQQGP